MEKIPPARVRYPEKLPLTENTKGYENRSAEPKKLHIFCCPPMRCIFCLISNNICRTNFISFNNISSLTF
jgi:hypothetical protein